MLVCVQRPLVIMINATGFLSVQVCCYYLNNRNEKYCFEHKNS